jgi:flagellar motor switch protein FliM
MADAGRILSQHEVDALLSAIDTGTAGAAADLSAAPYDFRRPSRLSRDQLRGIEALHEGYARSLQASLAAVLRTGVEVRLSGVHQGTLREFLQSLPRPTVLTIVTAEPLEGHFILELNASVACPMIERLLGSSQVGAWRQDRPLSALEWNVIDTVFLRAQDLLREAWAPVAQAAFRTISRESDPAALPLGNTHEPSVSVILEISIGDQRGCMDLIFPLVALEGHLGKFGARTPLGAHRKVPGGTPGEISKRLAPAEVRMEVSLPAEDLRVRDMRALRRGDILVTRHPQGAPLVASVEGQPKFEARLGSLRNRKAIQVLGPAAASTPPGAPARPPMQVVSGGAPPASIPEAAASRALVEHLLRLPLTASVVLAEKALRVRDVLALKAGDLLEFARRAEDPLELRAASRPLALGAAVRVGERFGFRVASVRGPRERLEALGP